MDRHGIAEAGGGAVVSGLLAIGAPWLAAGYVDWVLVVGLAAGVAIATEAPEVTADNFENDTPVKVGDGGTEDDRGDVEDDYT